MPGRLIAIGDIHGCAEALEALLKVVRPTPADTVVTLGDYIDRGPDSRRVIDRLIELQSQTQLIPLRGNHEEMMLAVLEGQLPYQEWITHGGVATLDSYGFDGRLDFLPTAHHRFLEGLRDWYETDTHFFVHAAYVPDLPLDEQPGAMLRWHSLRSGVPGPHVSGRVAVVGHTAAHDGEILDVGHLMCIDTWCYGEGYLTAIDLGRRRFWQARADGTLRRQR